MAVMCRSILSSKKLVGFGAARTLETRVEWLAMRMGSAPIPIIPVATTCVNVSDYARGLLRKHGIDANSVVYIAVGFGGARLAAREVHATARAREARRHEFADLEQQH